MLGNNINNSILNNGKRSAEETDQDASSRRTKTSRRNPPTEQAQALIDKNAPPKQGNPSPSIKNLPTEVMTKILLTTSPNGRARFGQADRWAKQQFEEAQLALFRPYSDSEKIKDLLFSEEGRATIGRHLGLKKFIQNILTERPFSAEEGEKLHDFLCSEAGREVLKKYPPLNDLIKNTILKQPFSQENGARIYSFLCSEEGQTALDKSPPLNALIKGILSKNILSNEGSEHIHDFLSSPEGRAILHQETEEAFRKIGKDVDLNEAESLALKQHSPVNELIKGVIAQQVSSDVIGEKICRFYCSEQGLQAFATSPLLHALFRNILATETFPAKQIHEFLCDEEGRAALTQYPALRPLIEDILAQHIDTKHVEKAVTLLCATDPENPVITRQHLVDFEWCRSKGADLSAEQLPPEHSDHVFKRLLLLLSQEHTFDGERFLQISPKGVQAGVLWTYDELMHSSRSNTTSDFLRVQADFGAMLGSKGFIHDGLYNIAEDEDENIEPHPTIWASRIDRDPRLLRNLLQRNFNPNACNADGESALHLTAKENRVSSAHLLLQYHAKLDARDSQGQTPLHNAAAHSFNVTSVFIKAGANINAQDNHGRTPLHAAISAEEMSSDVVQLLLAEGSDKTIKDNNGLTARELAQQMNRGEIFDSLLTANQPRGSKL